MKLTKKDKENIGYCLYYLDFEYEHMTKQGQSYYDELCSHLQFPVYKKINSDGLGLILDNHRKNRNYVPRKKGTNIFGGPILE